MNNDKTESAKGEAAAVPANFRHQIATVIEYTVKYYKAEVGDRIANVYDIADAVLLECSPYLRQEAAAVGDALPERNQAKPAEQQGVFRKFIVRRVDGSDEPGGKHHGCEYFVLDTDHDQHAKAALVAYAQSCQVTHPELSRGMVQRYNLTLPDIESIQQEYYKRGWKESQEHYLRQPSPAQGGDIRAVLAMRDAIKEHLESHHLDYHGAAGKAFEALAAMHTTPSISDVGSDTNIAVPAHPCPKGAGDVSLTTPPTPAVQDAIGLLEPIADINWHGKWRIRKALDCLRTPSPNAAPSPPMTVWQDISIAPKDGTRILCLVNDDVYILQWGIVEPLGTKPSWVTDSEGPGYSSQYNPTGWQPLPTKTTGVK